MGTRWERLEVVAGDGDRGGALAYVACLQSGFGRGAEEEKGAFAAAAQRLLPKLAFAVPR